MENQLSLEERIERMKAETALVCAVNGVSSPACAVCQEVLEEMRAARYHRNVRVARAVLKEFCLDHCCII